MRKLMSGVLIGFGSAVSIIIFTAWHLLLLCVDSNYLLVGEAKVMKAAQMATYVGIIFGVLLLFAGLVLEVVVRLSEDNSPTFWNKPNV